MPEAVIVSALGTPGGGMGSATVIEVAGAAPAATFEPAP